MTSSEIAFAIFIAKHNLPMAVGDEFGPLANKMWSSTIPVAHPGGEKNTNYRFSRFFVRAVPLFRSLMLTPMCSLDVVKKCGTHLLIMSVILVVTLFHLSSCTSVSEF